MAYTLLGKLVWRAAKWYVRRQYGALLPARRTVAAAGLVGAIIIALLIAGERQGSSGDGPQLWR